MKVKYIVPKLIEDIDDWKISTLKNTYKDDTKIIILWNEKENS